MKVVCKKEETLETSKDKFEDKFGGLELESQSCSYLF